MGKKKLLRFSINEQRHNVIQHGKDWYDKIKGHWSEYFGNQNDLVLELACGRGEYTTGLAAIFPDKNFVGVDIKGARIWKGSSVAVENNLKNAAFLRAEMYFIENFFAENEVQEIWITFPDPRPRDKHEKHRLTHPDFLNKYAKILKPGGILHLKTDNDLLFQYTLDVINQSELKIDKMDYTWDLYNSEFNKDHYGISTTYEKKFLKEGIKPKYLRVVTK